MSAAPTSEPMTIPLTAPDDSLPLTRAYVVWLGVLVGVAFVDVALVAVAFGMKVGMVRL